MPPRDRPRVLVVDDQPAMAEMVGDALDEQGMEAVVVSSGKEAARRLEKERVDALVTDLRMPDLDGLELLALSQKLSPERPVIVMTAYGAIDSAIESIRRGASHYLTKPFKLEELVIFLQRSLEQAGVRRQARALEKQLRVVQGAPIVGKSAAMREALETIARVADADVPVLLLGETGTGKSLAARTLHAQSTRANGPFVAVNCAALPDNLLESELFGHVRGAFTGATSSRDGLFVDADGGTLFLDEIGEMSTSLQAKLLHAIEHRTVRPVGGDHERAVDVRIVAATHKDLRKAVAEKTFREDLLYRLDVVSIELPALRHRRDDVPELVETFFRGAREKHPTSPARRLSTEALEILLGYAWPGNVRELAHAIERAVLLARGEEVRGSELPESIRRAPAPSESFAGDVRTLREIQRRYAAWALQQSGGHRSRTAEKLGVDRKTLGKLLDESEGKDE
jgi:two-component system response regulator HydG